jgi:hypothetical protein
MYGAYGQQPDNKRRPNDPVALSAPSDPKRFAGALSQQQQHVGMLAPPPPPPGVSSWAAFSSSDNAGPGKADASAGAAARNAGGKSEDPFDTLLCYDAVNSTYVCPFS